MSHGARFPRWVYGHGADPDVRFSLANERTFLAWVRTSLAFLAVGVALESFDLQVEPRLRLAGALVFMALGVALPVWSWAGWSRTERAIRRGEPLPTPVVGRVAALGVVAGGSAVLLGVLLR